MIQETRGTALVLPDEAQFRRDIQAINRFQQIVHQTMVRGLDYGVIPGTGNKPTLLKPGAEKIAKLLGLSDQYEIIDRLENWETGFFHYQVRCKLIHIVSGAVVSEGLGECNSMESKYRWRWVFPNDIPEGIDHSKLVKRAGKRKDGKGTYTQYRIDNDDIYSQVNTILKMSKKRALVDASLSAGRLSDIFTQDVEDTTEIPEEEDKSETKSNLSPLREKLIEKLEGRLEPELEPIPQPAETISSPVTEKGNRMKPEPAKEAPKTRVAEIPEFKTAAELFNYALGHGISVEEIKRKTGYAYPNEVVDLQAAIKALFP